MKKIIKITLGIMFLSIFLIQRSSAQGDVTAKISVNDLNQTLGTLIDSKGMNVAACCEQGPLLFGSRNHHVSVKTGYVTLSEAQNRAYLHLTLKGNANLSILWLFNFEIYFDDVTLTLIGSTSLQAMGDGYKLKFTPLGFQDFSYTGIGFLDALIADFTFAGYINRLPEVVFVSYNPLFPNVVGQYFTTPVPTLKIKDDGIYAWLDVNEAYLGYANETGTKNYDYRYIEAGPNYTIDPGSTVNFTHGTQGVLLTDGFTSEEGSEFTTIFDPNLDNGDGNGEGDNLAILNRFTEPKKVVILDTARPENIGKPLNIPDEYAIYQNYPNPFNPVTTIKYDLKAETKVSLVIYDILGREVKRLVDWVENAGYKTVSWNSKDKNGLTVSSGVYFYTIRAGDFVKTNKMLIVK